MEECIVRDVLVLVLALSKLHMGVCCERGKETKGQGRRIEMGTEGSCESRRQS